MRLYIDINTGQLKRNVDGAVLGPLQLYLKNILPLELVFIDGTESVTTEVLADAALLKVGIKAQPGAASLLALASNYVLNGEVAVLTLNLNTTELVNYFSANVTKGAQAANLFLEIQVTSADESTTETYHQSKCVVNRNVNSASDTNPSPADTALYVLKASLFDGNGRGISPDYVARRREVTARTGGAANCLDYIQTPALTLGTVFLIKIAGSGGELWELEQDAVTEADGVFVIDPVDFHAVNNPRKWKRIL